MECRTSDIVAEKVNRSIAANDVDPPVARSTRSVEPKLAASSSTLVRKAEPRLPTDYLGVNVMLCRILS